MMRISDITKHGSTNGPIMGKVMVKSNLGTYEHPRTGKKKKMFTCMLRDEYGGNVEVAFFTKNIYDLHDFVQLYHEYEITHYYVLNIDEEFDYSGHRYRLVVNHASSVYEADKIHVKPLNFHLTPISKFHYNFVNGPVNILGVVLLSEDVKTVWVGSRQESVRNIHVADQSWHRIKVRLWAHNARDSVFDTDKLLTVLVYGVRQDEYHGRSFLATGMNSMVVVDPKVEMHPEHIMRIEDQIYDLEEWVEDGMGLRHFQPCEFPDD